MPKRFAPHVERLAAVAASPAGDRVAVAGARDVPRSAGAVTTQVTVLEWPKLTAAASLEIAGPVCGLWFCRDGLLAVACESGDLELWDPSGHRIARDAGRHRGAVRAVTADPSGRRLASVGDDGVLKLSELDGGGAPSGTRAHEMSPRPLRAVAIDPEGAIVAAGGDDGVVRSLVLGNGSADPREMEMPEPATALAFLGDGRIAIGCGDGSIRICYLEGAPDAEDRSGKRAHEGPVRRLVHTPELLDEAGRPLPRRLLSFSEDGTLRSWEIDSRRAPKTIKVSSDSLTAAALIAAPKTTIENAEADARGGTLVVVDRGRGIALLSLGESGVPSESIERVHSRLDELADNLGSSAVKTSTLSALAALPEDEARVLLDRALRKDSKPAVRKAAAEAIGQSDRRLSRPALREALDDGDAEVRAAALAALTRIERDAPVAAARAALASKHADMRTAAVGRLPGLRESSPLVPTLVAGCLDDGESEVRFAALDALYELESGEPLEAARTALGRGPADVRREVIGRIGRSRLIATEEGARLVESALDDGDESVRAAAFLAGIAARAELAAAVRQADPHTAKALDDIERGGAFAEAAAAPAAIDDEALRPLFAALACRSSDTALRAARCLALLRDPRATGALLQLSRESDAGVRRHVVEALYVATQAMPSDPRPAERLRWLLDDPEETVRQDAFACLAQIASEPAAEIELAALALGARWPDVRVRALPILVKYGPESVEEGDSAAAERAARADHVLGDALDDEHDKVRGEAFRTLWAWHSRDPEKVLTRAARSRQAEVRKRVVDELRHQSPTENPWADALLLELVGDGSEEVGLAAFEALTESDEGKRRVDVHLAAMGSPRPRVRARGCETAPDDPEAVLLVDDRLIELVEDDNPVVHIAAIEALDRLDPDNASGFALAFGSLFYGLRVRAMELCGRRRDRRCVEPAKKLLSIPEGHINRPPPPLRQRAARALADAGDADAIEFLVGLLDDDDPVVREMGARGLATACRPGDEKPLVDATAHADLAVRSWAAEGLARLGDVRALPVLAGTQGHDHLPIRKGAILGFVALGPDGVRGLLAALDDPLREIQELAFAVIVARDIALQGMNEPPDLLLSALSAANPEVRFAAARLLEGRDRPDDPEEAIHEVIEFAAQLVGPRVPEKTSEQKDWPEEDERDRRLEILVRELASDHPAHRYAAAQVLSLRNQPLAFWREAAILIGPVSSSRPRIPFTNWDDEPRQPKKRGWIRSLLPRAGGTSDGASQLAFGTYAGLIRQAPAPGEADETHRVRRDAVGRLGALAASPSVGREAVLPVLRRALSDPHHMVRRAAVAALRGLYPAGALEPLALELQSSAADVGRGAVDALITKALEPGSEVAGGAHAAALDTINAPVAEVRRYAMGQLPRLFDSGSMEPWLVAMNSRYSDVRLSVVYRLIDSSDERVLAALGRAMESDHEDLRLQAAAALARRGDVRTVEVLAGLLHSDSSWWEALDALVDMALVRSKPECADAAALAVIGRLEDDPDQTADRYELFEALDTIRSPAAADFLLRLVGDPEADEDERDQAFNLLVQLAVDSDAGEWRDADGEEQWQFIAERALAWGGELIKARESSYRRQLAERVLRFIRDPAVEPLLAELVEDRDESVRVAACEALAYRARNFEGASVGALSAALRGGRRELVLPAAEGLAAHQRGEAFQPLMLVFVAGEQEERRRAVLALGSLGDARALPDLEALLDPSAELEDEDRALLPAATEALGRTLCHLDDPEVAARVRRRVEELAREGAPAIRAAAFAGLRAAGDEASRTFLEAIAGDRLENESARLQAVIELGKLAAPESEGVLTDIVRSEGYSLCSSAMETLEAIFPDDKTRTSLIALKSAVSHFSEAAASYLAWRGDTDTLVARLSQVSDRAVRTQLRLGLIRRGAAPVEPLTELLSSSEARDRIDGCWIAGSAAEPSLARAVAAAAARAPEAYREARSRLAGRGDDAGAERLDDAAEAWEVALWAAGRLETDARGAARAALEGAAAERPPLAVRLAALRYLGERGTAADIELVTGELTCADAPARAAAAAAVASLDPRRAPGILATVEVADAAAVGPMVELALDADTGELMSTGAGRQLALPVLLAGGRDRDLAQIATAAGSGDERLAAIAALGRLGTTPAAEALGAILAKDGEPDEVRAEAYRALRRLERRAAKIASMKEAPAS